MSWNTKRWNLLISVAITSVLCCTACNVANITACIDEASTLLTPLDANGQFDVETFCDYDNEVARAQKVDSCNQLVRLMDSCSEEEKEIYYSQLNNILAESGTKFQQNCVTDDGGCAHVTTAVAAELEKCNAPMLQLATGSFSAITEVCQVLQEGLDCYAAAVGDCDQLDMYLTEGLVQLKPYEAICPGLNYKNKPLPGLASEVECSLTSVESKILVCDLPILELSQGKNLDRVCEILQEALDCYAEAMGNCTQPELHVPLQSRLFAHSEQLVYCPDLNYKGGSLTAPGGQVDCRNDATWEGPYNECAQILYGLGADGGAIYETNLTEACRIAQSGLDCLSDKLGQCEDFVEVYRELFVAMRASSTACGGHLYNGKTIEELLEELDGPKPPSYTCFQSATECVNLLFGAGAPHGTGSFFDLTSTGNFQDTCRAVRSSAFRRSQDCIDAVIDECDMPGEQDSYNERNPIRALSQGLQAMSHMCDCSGDVSGEMATTVACLTPILSLTNYAGTLTKEVCSTGQQALSCAKPTLDRCPYMFQYIMRQGDPMWQQGARGDADMTVRRDMLEVIRECDLDLSDSVQEALKATNSVSTVHTIAGSLLLFFTTSMMLVLRN